MAQLKDIMTTLQTEEVGNVELLAKKKNGDIVKVDGNSVASAEIETPFKDLDDFFELTKISFQKETTAAQKFSYIFDGIGGPFYVYCRNDGQTSISECKLYGLDENGQNVVEVADIEFGKKKYIDANYPKYQLFRNQVLAGYSVHIEIGNKGFVLDDIQNKKAINGESLTNRIVVAGSTTSISRLNHTFKVGSGKKEFTLIKNSAYIKNSDVYVVDSTGVNARYMWSNSLEFDKRHFIDIPEGYDSLFFFKNSPNPSGLDLTLNVFDATSLSPRVDFLETDSAFIGSKIVCFGDSITEFTEKSNTSSDVPVLGYCEYLSNISGAKVIRAGSAGARLAQRRDPVSSPTSTEEAYAAFDICNIIRAWCNQDWDKVDAARVVLEASGDDCSFIDKLKQITPADTDCVTIFGGTNDFTQDSTIGDVSDNNRNSILGAINCMVQDLRTANPRIRIFFFTPIVRCFDNVVDYAHFSDNWVTPSTRPHMWGKKLPDLCEIIASQASARHCNVLNWYWTLGWDLTNFSEFFRNGDGTHPYKGFKWIAQKMFSFIRKNW